MIKQLFEALNSINWSKGKGDILSVTIEVSCQHDFRGTVFRKMTSFTDTRSFTVKDNTVKFLGRQRKIPLTGR